MRLYGTSSTQASRFSTPQPAWSWTLCVAIVGPQFVPRGSRAASTCTAMLAWFETRTLPLRSRIWPRGAGIWNVRMLFWAAAATYWSECSTWSAHSRKSSTPSRAAAITPSAAARSASGTGSGVGSGLDGGRCRYIGSDAGRAEQPPQERQQDQGEQGRLQERGHDLVPDEVAEVVARPEQHLDGDEADLHEQRAGDDPRQRARRRRLEHARARLAATREGR